MSKLSTKGSNKKAFSLVYILEKSDTDLARYIYSLYEKQSYMPKNEIKRIFKEILKGVDHIHRNQVMHRDIKTGNILISNNGEKVQVIDFGQAEHIQFFRSKPLEPSVGKSCLFFTYLFNLEGTNGYRAPELILGFQDYSFAVDIWSLGCVFLEMFYGRCLFGGVNCFHEFLDLCRILGTPDEHDWFKLKDPRKNKVLVYFVFLYTECNC